MFLFSVPAFLYAQVEEDKTTHTTREFGLSDDFSEFVRLELDTVITGFQQHRIIEIKTPFFINLGNYGLPVVEIDFFKRTTSPDDFLFRHYKPYMHHTGNVRFVNTQVPFSELIFTFGAPRVTSEQTFSVRHSQNINQFLNFGLDLDVIYSQGQYNYQKADDRSFTFHTSYTGKKYEFLGAWNLNNFIGYNNGGVEDMGSLLDSETRDIAVKLGELNSSSTTLKNKSLLFVQRFTIAGSAVQQTDSTNSRKRGNGFRGVLSHIIIWENNKRFYADKDPSIGFYDTAFISNPLTNNVPTYDSLYSRILTNTLRFDFMTSETSRFQIGVGVGVMNELNLYSQIIPTFDTLFSDTLRWDNNSNALIGKLYNRIGDKFGWEAYGKLYFTGIRSGDFSFNGKITKLFGSDIKRSELYARGAFINTGPSWWQNRWGSNHFVWDNDLKKELRLNFGGGFRYHAAYADVSFDYSLITNYIFFNRNAVPDQYDGSISVIAIRLNKNFRFWKLNSDNNLLIQKSSHRDILDLPMLSIRSSFYFNHMFHFKSTGGKLDFQIGFEAVYHTPFYAYDYMPATVVFYNQNTVKSGNYPYVNVFTNLKLKRSRFFISFEHLNSGLMGNEYFIVPDYPMPVRTFKYGISWTFYN